MIYKYILPPQYLLFTCLFLFLCPSTCFSTQKTSQFGSFTRFYSGARRQAMGNAYSGIIGDATSVSDNPAGIIGVQKLELTGFHAPLYLDVIFDSVYIVLPTRKIGNFGIGWQSVNAGEFEKRTDPLDVASTFGVYEQAGYLAYAYQFSEYAVGGLAGKIVHHKIDSYADTSFGADIGLILFSPFPKNLQAGFRIANIIAPKLTLKTQEEQYALRPRFGLAYSIYDLMQLYGHDVTFSCDIEKQEYPLYRLSYGFEYALHETIGLRLGLDAGKLAAGLGVKVSNYQVDYAVSDHDLGLTQKFSVSLRFGFTLAEMEHIRNKKYERVTKKDAYSLSQSYTRIGLELYDKKEHEKAIAEWEKALIWNHKNTKAQELKESAEGLLAELKRKKELDDHEVLAHAYSSDKKWSDSLSEWEKVLALDKDHKQAQDAIAEIKEKISLSAQEREHYAKLKTMAQKGEISRLNQDGWGYYKVGEYSKAIDAWKKIF
ncbi:MAG: PorV/PorQ family protein, partial [bacterium]